MRQLKKWKCAVCGEDIIEGQVFTFYAKGPVHWECLEKELSGKVYKDADSAALLRLDHFLHEGIVLAKELEYLAQGEAAKERIREVRKQLEVLAAKLTNELTSKLI
ncbi:Uncharacterized protein conserved in archaea [Pyrobaculum oguniense TE7]|uniref:Uncharacterized protein conserved in archaea n=1 Tax=Pyrobaculum oguniense (strain DSM 13380 / JCM 10595 / TE7) TaxID=698757 RepID=H6Q6E9_PYROT|nr:Uncharacterized protein conserved in archaea [Pyrobaculum oguniense TE7]